MVWKVDWGIRKSRVPVLKHDLVSAYRNKCRTVETALCFSKSIAINTRQHKLPLRFHLEYRLELSAQVRLHFVAHFR
jgi:hypothetical protein